MNDIDFEETSLKLVQLGIMAPGEMNGFSRMSDDWDIATEEVELAQAQNPERAEDIDKVWRACFRTQVIANSKYDDRVYRHHIRQLIQRQLDGEDLRPATDAELLCAFMGAALQTPLISRAHGLIMMLFQNIYPDFEFHDDPEIDARIKDPTTYDAWGGEVEELIAEERMKQMVDFRKARE